MLITIIIPIYNRAKTLPECLDSIINQEHSEFECLLIDDGSHDDSLKVCNDYADKDSRFRVFHKTNGGVRSARSLGLENATGEWVAFVDSDDIIAPNHLSQFATAIQKYPNVDILFCGCQYVCRAETEHWRTGCMRRCFLWNKHGVRVYNYPDYVQIRCRKGTFYHDGGHSAADYSSISAGR